MYISETALPQGGGVSARVGSVVQWATDTQNTLTDYVSVDHGGFDILVAQEFLNRADIHASFQEMGCERMAECVWAHAFVDADAAGGLLDGFLDCTLMEVEAV